MAKISLCLIVGNVEEYIERCLKSFLPIADEVCIVRAIGNQVADATLSRAITVCSMAGIQLKTAEYKNRVVTLADHGVGDDYQVCVDSPSNWPHVDDFAAARQMSFDLASGDYCFWCDTDDVLECGAEIVRELADRCGYPVYIFPYKIFGRGVVVPRERMTIRGGGRWISPVHEFYQFPIPVAGVQDDRVVITHLPHTTKNGSNERNFRILSAIPEAERTAGIWFHLHGEFAGKGLVREAVECANRALAHPDLGKPEKYELFLNLARLAQSPDLKFKLLHAAHASDPERREALSLLTCTAMDYGRNVTALAYGRQMMATIKPCDESWNDRAAAYDWLGVDIYTQALRVNGRGAEADKIRRQALAAVGGPRIALIHATRGRAHQASVAKKLWFDLAEHPEWLEHIFVFDHDDPESFALRRMHHLEINPGGGCVAAWNNGAMAVEAPVMIQMSDDWIPLPQWDRLILERLGDLAKPSVLAISDGSRNDKLLCMAICTRNYWAQDFFLFHPRFKGVYSDNYFTDTAYARGQVIEARDLVFQHQHPAFGQGAVDATYARQNSASAYRDGKAVYDDLTAHPEKDFSSVPGFCNFWTFYVELAARMKDGDTFAEVGVWLGRSLIFLAQELQRQGKRCKLIAVDTFKGEANQPEHYAAVQSAGGSVRAMFEQNLRRCGVADLVEIIEGDSAASAAQVADGSLFGAFIDAAHDSASVKRDHAAWRPKVRAQGILCGHDADYEPVRLAVLEVEPQASILGCVWIA